MPFQALFKFQILIAVYLEEFIGYLFDIEGFFDLGYGGADPIISHYYRQLPHGSMAFLILSYQERIAPGRGYLFL